MPPPPWPPASAPATRFADHWVADYLACNESYDFSVVQALLGASPEVLSSAPEATRERIALRSLQEVSSLVPAAGDAAATAATAAVLRVDGARSCEGALLRLIGEVEISGKLDKDLLLPFSQGIQETIRSKKFALPETSFQLLKGVEPWILHQPCTPESRSCVPPQEDTTDAVGLGARAGCDAPLQGSISEPFSQQDKHDHTAAVEPKSCRQKSPNLPHCADGEGADDGGSSNQSSKVSSHEELSAHATVTPGFDRISDILPTDASETRHLPECITAQDTTVISQPDSRKSHLSALLHERGEKVNQDLEDVSASIQPVEKDHSHGDLTLQSASALLPVSCNGANQGSKSDIENAEVSGANKANQALHDDGSIMKNDTVHGGLTVQTDKTSEANCFSEQKNETNRTAVQKDNNCRISIPSSSKDRDRERAKKTSNEEKSEDTSPEISACSQDQDIDDILEGLSQEDLCIKCRKDAELLTCSDCLLAVHASCFGSSVTFEGTNLLNCPVCCFKNSRKAYEKAKKTYFEAKENKAAYRGTAQVSKQHDEQLNGVQLGAAKRDGHSNGSDISKRNNIHQNEAYDRDEEHHQPRKKQKVIAGGNGYPKEVLTEKDPFQNSCPASINKLPVPQNNSMTQVKDTEKKQQAGDKEARKEAGNPSNQDDDPASMNKLSVPQNNSKTQVKDPEKKQKAGDKEACKEEPHQPKKKQKISAQEVLNEKDPFQNSGPASMNKHSVLQNNSKTQVKDPEKKQQAGDKEACKEAGNPPSNQDDEADQEDSLTASNQSGGKRSPPPRRIMRYSKKRKGSSAHLRKRYSNPLAPPGRRPKLDWTEPEEAMLREAMAKFPLQNGVRTSWIQIRDYGSNVFHKTRLPLDLRDKWRNMNK